MPLLYLDDFSPGQRFAGLDRLSVDHATLKAFAAEFDPQPFHLDEVTAKDSVFRGLAASGWHTAALTMRLLTGSDLKPVGGIIGAGFDELRWPLPVRPGDVLRVETEILEVRASKSMPGYGLVKVRTNTFNQDDNIVQTSIGNVLVPRQVAP